MISLFTRPNKFQKLRWTMIRQKRGILVIYLKFFMIVCLVLAVFLLQKHCNVDNLSSELIEKILFVKNNHGLQYEQEIQSDLAKQVPGLCEFGVKCLLTGDDKERGELSFAAQGMNVVLSDLLSYNRTPPDIQNSLCKLKKYDQKQLPKASVIIIFYNEPYSALLRTVHSVLNTANKELVEEIILVDDCSSLDDLKGKLDYFIKTRLHKKVKLLRLPKK